jgi:leader peptidase (prepilin peptidase)/N-methyltransferase
MTALFCLQGSGALLYPSSKMTLASQFFSLTTRYELRRWEVVACAVLGLALTCILTFFTVAIVALAGGYMLFTMLLVMLIDYRQFIIPDALSLPAAPLGLAAALFAFPAPAQEVLLDQVLAAFVAGGSLYAVRALYFRARGVEGLGLGDVKLATAAGAWVGLEALPMTCLLATVAALTVVLVRSAFVRSAATRLTTAIPFGSFIAPAIIIMWLIRLLVI